jgi:hypothetical protein
MFNGLTSTRTPKPWDRKETPRQRIARFNNQIKSIQETYNNFDSTPQPLCTFCVHLKVYTDLEGTTDADCDANAKPWREAHDFVSQCAEFRVISGYKIKAEMLITESYKRVADRLLKERTKEEANIE